MKYVMFKATRADVPDQYVPIIFPDFMVHSVIAETSKAALTGHGYASAEPFSAGFYRPGTPSTTYGKSGTLNLDSRPEDAWIIDTYPYTHGLMDGPLELPMTEGTNRTNTQEVPRRHVIRNSKRYHWMLTRTPGIIQSMDVNGRKRWRIVRAITGRSTSDVSRARITTELWDRGRRVSEFPTIDAAINHADRIGKAPRLNQERAQ